MVTMNKLSGVDFGQLQDQATPKFASGTKLGTVVNQVLILLFPLAGIVVFFYLIYGGYQYLMSQGDPKAIASAQQTITYAVIGFLVMVSAYFVVQALGVTLNLSVITDMF